MGARFNVPPNWPQPPTGWVPPIDWRPDPAWPPPPAGWQFWVDDAAQPSVAPAGPYQSHPQAGADTVPLQPPAYGWPGGVQAGRSGRDRLGSKRILNLVLAWVLTVFDSAFVGIFVVGFLVGGIATDQLTVITVAVSGAVLAYWAVHLFRLANKASRELAATFAHDLPGPSRTSA